MATIPNLQGKGMQRMASQNPKSFATLPADEQSKKLDELIKCCDDCCNGCQQANQMDCFDQCDDVRTQLKSAKSAAASGQAMAIDWATLFSTAMTIVQMIIAALNKKNPTPPPTPTVQGAGS